MAGAEPFSATGGPDGVLVLHGFTGNPSSMRGVAEKLADAGLTVELPLLPGHGTSWTTWSPRAGPTGRRRPRRPTSTLAARCDRVAVVGLSMGGTLTCWLAERHPEISGIVADQPLGRAARRRASATGRARAARRRAPRSPRHRLGHRPARRRRARLRRHAAGRRALALRGGRGRGARPRRHPLPGAAASRAARTTWCRRPTATCWRPRSADRCERVWLERSYHVATLDYDRDEIEDRTVSLRDRRDRRGRAVSGPSSRRPARPRRRGPRGPPGPPRR